MTEQQLRLYDFPSSGNCHKIRIMLSLLGLDYETRRINLLKGEQMSADFLRLNPLHKVPVLDDGGVIITDSAAILIYLARKHGRSDLYPEDALGMAEIQKWLSFSANEVFNGLALSRAMVIFNRDQDQEALNAVARKTLEVFEAHLGGNQWMALSRMTIADIACYPYTAGIEEGEIPLEPYANIRAWLARCEAIPGFVPMPAFEPMD